MFFVDVGLGRVLMFDLIDCWFLVVGSENGINFWNVEIGEFDWLILGYLFGIIMFKFYFFCNCFVSGGIDKFLIMWDVDMGIELFNI